MSCGQRCTHVGFSKHGHAVDQPPLCSDQHMQPTPLCSAPLISARANRCKPVKPRRSPAAAPSLYSPHILMYAPQPLGGGRDLRAKVDDSMVIKHQHHILRRTPCYCCSTPRPPIIGLSPRSEASFDPNTATMDPSVFCESVLAMYDTDDVRSDSLRGAVPHRQRRARSPCRRHAFV